MRDLAMAGARRVILALAVVLLVGATFLFFSLEALI